MLINSAFSEEPSISTVSAVKIMCFGLCVSFQLPLSGRSCCNSCICKSRKQGALMHLSPQLLCLQHQGFNAYTNVIRLTVLIFLFLFFKKYWSFLPSQKNKLYSFLGINTRLCNRTLNKN